MVLAAATLGAVLLASPPQPATDRRVLVFSKTAGFRHDSIPDGIALVRRLGAEGGFSVDATEDAGRFTDAGLAPYDALIFLSTTGGLFDAAQKAAFQRYVRAGGGFVGVHAATNTEQDWPWYVALVGASFASHPDIQTAALRVADPRHVSTRHLPAVWTRTDEWYDFLANPRDHVQVLLILDEASYSGGAMGADHPIAWCRYFDGGRSWYTALGHTRESFAEPLLAEHVRGGIRFAAGYPDCDERRPREIAPRPDR